MDVVQTVEQAIETSEIIACSKRIKGSAQGAQVLALGDAAVSPVSAEVIEILESNGCSAEDWARVKAVDGLRLSRVQNVTFFGDVVLGAFSGAAKVAQGIELPTGVYRSIIGNCCIGNDALVSDVKLLANYVVREGAVVLNVGELSTAPGSEFGNGTELPLAIETGGRDTRVYAEITIPVAAWVGSNRGNKGVLANYSDAVDEYVEAVKCDMGVVDVGAHVKNTARVISTYVGPHAEIDNANEIVDSTILSNEDETVEIVSGGYVNKSLIQWGCEVATMAIVDSSVLTEHSHVERHGKVTESIVGPNSGVAEGEVTASLLGPFVGFHHQALLIAAFWPEGKGNVGYGANVGSNHTSKAPDQELWPGEGAFFGLGTNVKFPSDFTKAPYLIMASGVSALPQKVTFPFSLINTPAAQSESLSPAFNEIFPGWVLSDNMFTLKRNEGKYKERNEAKRTEFVFDVFRPDTVRLMQDARQRLTDVAEVKDLYTSRDIKGLGKNYMLESSRGPAIAAYTFGIQYFALLGLKERVKALVDAGETDKVASLLSDSSECETWELQRQILAEELGDNDVAANLKLLSEMQEQVAADVQKSKEKDDLRGAKIIDDYPEAHGPAAEDSFVQDTWRETRAMQAEIHDLLTALA